MKWLSAALGIMLMCSVAGNATTLQEDKRLEQTVKIRETGEQLTTILQRLKLESGVALNVDSPMGDTVIVCKFEGKMSEWMETLAQYFAVSKEQVPTWYRTGNEWHYSYTLSRDLSSKKTVQGLRDKNKQMILDRLELLNKARKWSKLEWDNIEKSRPEFATMLRKSVFTAERSSRIVWHVMDLPQLDRNKLLDGKILTYKISELCGTTDPDKYIQDWLGEGQIDPPDRRSTVTLYITGRGKQTSFAVKLDFKEASPGTVANTSVSMSDLFDDISKENQRDGWLRDIDVSAPPSTTKFTLGKVKVSDRPLYREYVLAVADKAGVNILFDDYGWNRKGYVFEGETTIDQWLNIFCAPPADTARNDDGSGYLWWKKDNTYLIKSLTWAEDEVNNVPQKLVEKWRASRKKSGYLSIPDLAEMASLNTLSLPILSNWFPEANTMGTAVPMLRWYNDAKPHLKEKLLSIEGVSISELGLTTKAAVDYSSPTEDFDPLWTSLLNRNKPEDVRLCIRYGKRTDNRDGTVQMGVGIILRDPEAMKNSEHATLIVIPLTPEP